MAQVVKDWETFEILALPLAGAEPVRGLGRGRPVSAGELLALASGPDRGHLHAPVAGFLEAVRAGEIIIHRDEAAVGEPPRSAVLGGLPPAELARTFRELGLDLADPRPLEHFIISALDPEPGLEFARPLLAEHRETLAAGLAALRGLFPEARLVWAGLRPEDAPAGADEFLRARADYPWTLPALAGRSFIGTPDRAGGAATDLRRLFDLGRLWRTGLPLRRMVLTLGGATYFVPPGARPADLLASAHLEPRAGDAVVAGGLVRGRTLARLTRGLGRETAGLHLIRRAGPGPAAGPCRRCGDCFRACPAGLPAADFFARDPEEGPAPGSGAFEDCLECGACALACPARRPLLAWARLAKFPPSEQALLTRGAYWGIL
ncbi:MAG: 4Fe-4S dicluster domain-containing protein [Candidatus Adiutrix sp.]|jgi:electron transport complex protein RnfC|nr:4Fe-4S dicluster domain-containing protein [Candidatus Adiutrix sp.]